MGTIGGQRPPIEETMLHPRRHAAIMWSYIRNASAYRKLSPALLAL